MEKNQDIRLAIKKANLRHWQIAEICGISEGSFSRLLRKELKPEKKQEILLAIEKIKNKSLA